MHHFILCLNNMMSPLVLYPPPSFVAVYCYICGRRRVAVARYLMICLVHANIILQGRPTILAISKYNIQSPLPESFAISKKVKENSEWILFQYYNASCSRTYNKRKRAIITSANEDTALCKHKHSYISPLTGGSVSFSPLKGRPSAFCMLVYQFYWKI